MITARAEIEVHRRQAAPEPEPAPQCRLARWCGWVMVCAAGLVSPVAWLSPLGFAPLAVLTGLLFAPAVRVRPGDRVLIGFLILGAAWAAASCGWAPPRFRHEAGSIALQLGAWALIAYSILCGSRRASAALKELALATLLWGLAVLGLILCVEVVTDAALYRALNDALYSPIRIDLARRNVAESAYVVCLLAPLAASTRRLTRARIGLLTLALGGAIAAAVAFSADAPLLGLALGAAFGLCVWKVPRSAPKFLALGVAVTFLGMPGVILVLERTGLIRPLQAHAPASYAARLAIWRHALAFIEARPLKGWGVGATHAMGPAMGLHPHNAPLQIWAELGVVGAGIAAAGWAAFWLALPNAAPDRTRVAAAVTAGVYLTYQLISFGVWQAWFVGLGCMAAMFAAAAQAGKAAS